VLIVDDCSPDETPAVAEALMERDPRVEYVRQEQNLGLIDTANTGLAWATETGSDYTVVLSADDQLVPGSFLRAATVMEQEPGVGMVYGWATYAPTNRPLPEPAAAWRSTKVWSGLDWIRTRCGSGYNCISSPEVVVRSSVQQRAGLYDPACTHASDLNMWLRIAALSDIAHLRGVSQALYRVHADSMLRSDSSPLLSLRERRTAFECFFDGAGAVLPTSQRLRQEAARALARQALWRASRSIDRGLAARSERELVEDLIAFAHDVCPTAERLREWHGLRLRRAIGAGRSRWFPLFMLTGAVHRIRGEMALVRLRTRGI
jgi:hypothetical protein